MSELLVCFQTHLTGSELDRFDPYVEIAHAQVDSMRLWVPGRWLAICYLLDPDLVRRSDLDLLT